jgi:hypothetical protein
VCTLLALSAASAPAATNNISTGAGTGTAGYNGDGIPASTADLGSPIFVAATPDGGYLIAAQGNARVRKVLPDGTITTVAGNGTVGFSGDGGQATSAQFNGITDVEPMPDGGFLIADANNNRVRRVFANGTINTVAGTGTPAYNGDGIPATTANLAFPDGLSARPDGSFLISDNDNHRIRNVAADGTITTIAGTGAPGGGGDGGPATGAQLNGPGDVELMSDGGFLLADTDNNRVRHVSSGGTITAAAGTGALGFGGDGGLATLAQMRAPNGLAVLADGSYLIADRLNHRIRRVALDGIINTVAGNGTQGGAGDGGPATAAQLSNPFGVSVNTEGDYLIADTSNHRVRIVDAGDPPPPPPDTDGDGLVDSADACPTQPANTPDGCPPPELAKSANVRAATGRVTVKLKGEKSFKELTNTQNVPFGATFNTIKGTLEVVAEVKAGSTRTSEFSGAQLTLTQDRKQRVLEAEMAEKKLVCPRPKAKQSSLRASRSSRRLRARSRGRTRTRGRHGSATVRGTVWDTQELCEGTRFTAVEGSVTVRDFVKKKDVVLKAPRSYLARKKG